MIPLLRLFFCYQALAPQYTPQAFYAAFVASLVHSRPEFYHAQCRISPEHIADQLQFLLCVLVGMPVRPAGLLGKRLHAAVIALQPKVDVRTTLVVLPAGAGYAVFFGVSHHGAAGTLCLVLHCS